MTTHYEVKPTTDPAGRPAVLLQLEHGWITLLGQDARGLAARLLEAADKVMPDPLASVPLFCNATDGDFVCTLDGDHPGPHLAFGAAHIVRHAWAEKA